MRMMPGFTRSMMPGFTREPLSTHSENAGDVELPVTAIQ
jgi:hypothetical protein